MDTHRVNKDAQRRIALSAGADRPQECIFNPNEGSVVLVCELFSTPSNGAVAPDDHTVPGHWTPKRKVMTHQGKDSPQTLFKQKTAVAKAKPPGNLPGGKRLFVWLRCQFGLSRQFRRWPLYPQRRRCR